MAGALQVDRRQEAGGYSALIPRLEGSMKRTKKAILVPELAAKKRRETAEMIAELEKGTAAPQWPTRFKTTGCKKTAPQRD